MAEYASEGIRQPISTHELERRWAETRKAMAGHGIDCLLTQNANSYCGAYVRWFIDMPNEVGYPWTVIFPANEEMTTISHGVDSRPVGWPDWAVRGVKRRIGLPYYLAFNYTNTMDARVLSIPWAHPLDYSRKGSGGRSHLSHGQTQKPADA